MKIDFIFGIPNARMSSYLCFKHFQRFPHLDKFVSGIPNAITNQSPVAKNVAAARTRVCQYRKIPIERALVIAV
jgi:hypothetical protein